jgi:hypothetical protein
VFLIFSASLGKRLLPFLCPYHLKHKKRFRTDQGQVA